MLFALLLACDQPASAPPAPVAPAGPAPEAARAPGAAPAGGAVVASWQGGSLTYDVVQTELELPLKMLENEYLLNRYENELAVLQQKVDTQLLEAEAKKRGLPGVGDLLQAEVVGKTTAPSEAEVQEAYAQLARRFSGRPLEEVRTDVERAVMRRKQGDRQMAFLGELRKAYGLNVTLPFPDLPRFPVSADDDPSRGPADAPVTIIQFAEFQCPYCGTAAQTMEKVMAAYEGQVRFVYRDFPLGFHEYAIPAAIAATCADRQGRFWPMHDKLMANQRALTDADLERTAKEVGVELGAWNTCRKDPALEEEVRKDMADGSALGVEGTPAFFVNGVFVNGAQPFERFQAIIDKELAGRKG